MGEVILLDRHVLASPATAYDTAWSTYGVTSGARGRAGRLEEEVPWGTHVTRAADPARLSGPAEAVLDPSNLDRLGHAVLPLQRWIGFSLWGAFESGGTARRAERERRVLTHTLLLTGDAFRRIGGHPAGLLRSGGGGPASWVRELVESSDFAEPGALSPVRVPVDPASTAALARARLDELARLRRLVLSAVADDPGRLRGMLSDLYEALARTLSADGLRHVVVRGVGASTSALLRLVWLSLPLEDRLEVSFVTEQRRTERPRARLIGLAEAEWGRYVPDGSWVLGESDAFDPASGRDHWAELVTEPGFPDGFEGLDARAHRRGWRLVGAGDLDAEADRARWRSRWRADGPTLDGAGALWSVESGRPGGPRARAVGAALGRTAAPSAGSGPREAWIGQALELVGDLPAEWRAALVRGAVRELRRGGSEERLRAALLRCRSAAGGLVAGEELHRLVDRESDALRALLVEGSGTGGLDLILAAIPLAARGDPVGRELVRLGAAETRWTPERAEALARGLGDGDPERAVLSEVLGTLVRERNGAGVVLRAVPPAWLAGSAVLAALLEALDAGREPFGSRRSGPAAGLAGDLARRLLEGAGGAGLGEERAEAVLRLLWTAGSDRALDALDGGPAAEAAVLAELLVRPAPVPLFHRIRRRLDASLDAEASPGRPEGTRGLEAGAQAVAELGAALERAEVGEPRLRSYAPAVAARLRPAVDERRVFLARGR